MPCDRVTRPIKSENNIFEWETTSCIHKSYWEMSKWRCKYIL